VTHNELVDAILSRRSVRRFHPEPPSQETVELLLRAAMSAPSAGNQQPWEFVVVRGREQLARVPDFHQYASVVPSAPLAILVCCDLARQTTEGFWPQDCAAATENLLLAAHALGFAAVWLGVYPIEQRVEGCRQLFGLPDNVVAFSLVVVGRSAGPVPPPGERYDPGRVHHDRW
jgi:nitroreductase